MKRSTDQPPPQPQCALNPPQQTATGSSSSSNNSHQYQLPRDDRNSTQNRTPVRNSFQQYPVQPKRENHRMSQSWPANNYNNTNNNPWEGEWAGTPPVKNEPEKGDYYKQQHLPSRTHPPPSYPSSGGEWPPGPSTSSGGAGASSSSYGMIPPASSNSAAGSSYSENNGYGNYNSGYNNYGQLPYTQTNYNPQSSYHQSTRMPDSYQHHQQPKQQYQHHHNQQPQQHHQQHNQQPPYHHQQPKQHYQQSQYHPQPHHQSQYHHPRSQHHQQHHQQQNSNNSSRMPSVCPPAAKQEADRCGQVPDYQHTPKQYGMGTVPRVEVKQEPPDDYQTAENENFSSIFSHSLSSLYNDVENGDDPDVMVIDSPRLEHPTTPIIPPQEMNPSPVENHVTYQRLHSSGGHFVCNPSIDLRDAPSTSYGCYGNGVMADSQGSVMQEIGAPGASNSFRYDRPSFDDMHLYGPSTSSDNRTQTKKRKANGPPAPTEGSSERSKKCSRMVPLNSESQWTPNSFGFDGTHVKQEPMDDYTPMEVETPGGPPQDSSSPGSSGTGSNSRPSDQPHESKQPQKKRSPTTCFERFEKKSTDAKKKVSPISIYAKVVDNMVISVKCRRYKKRTKPAKAEESVSPCRMEVEAYRRYNLTPEQAAHAVMRELVDRVSLFGERCELGNTDLSEMEPYKIHELFMQFCHRSNLDFRDFEDTEQILIPRIVADTVAKNSERASAIRRRINTPPPFEPQPSTSGVQQNEVKTKRRRKKADEPDNSTTQPVEPRVLRQLPGRQARNNVSGYSPFALFSSRNTNGECVDVIDLSFDPEEEEKEQAGREAEVRKKSQPSKGKRPSKKAQVRDHRSLKEDDSEEPPIDKSRSKAKGKQPLRKKSLVEICLEDSNEPPAARSRSQDKSKKPARESSLDKCSNGGLVGFQIKQEPMDDYPSTELETSTSHFESMQGSSGLRSCKPSEQPKDHLEPQKKCENESTAMEQTLEEGKNEPVTGSRENDNFCKVELAVIQIKQEPMDDYPSIELETLVSHQKGSPVSSGIRSSQPLDQPMKPQEKQESDATAREQNLEETRNRNFEEENDTPMARSRSRSKGKQSKRKNQLARENSLDKNISCNGGLEGIFIKQEPTEDYESTELVTSVSLHQDSSSESSGIKSSRLPEKFKKVQGKQVSKGNVRDQSLEEVSDITSEEVSDITSEAVSEGPVARSRSRNKGRWPVGKKQLAREKSLDKDKFSYGGLAGLKIKQELMDDYVSSESEIQVPSKDIFPATRGTRSSGPSEQPKDEPKKPQKKRGRSKTNASKQSLEKACTYEGLRRSTRSSVKKAEVPEGDCKPLTRKRLRSMYSSDSMKAHEIVDITRSSGYASPPLLDAVNVERSTSKNLAQTKSKNSQAKGKNTSRGRKGKSTNTAENESPSVLKMPAKVKMEDTAEDEPPVLRKVSRKRTVNSRYIDDDIYIVPSGSRSRSNSTRTEPPTLPIVEEKIKIKQEPVSPVKNDQDNKFGKFNDASEKKAKDHNSSLSDSQKGLESKVLETPKNTIVKSGSSKRKQGGPTKFHKDKFKNVGFPPFLQPSSNPLTLASNSESSTSEKISNPNLVLNFGSPKVANTASMPFMPEIANSSETLKERYRKSFCTQPLPSTTSGHPQELEETKQKIASFLKSRDPIKKLKENLARTPVPKPEQRSSAQNGKPNVSGKELHQPITLSLCDVKVKQEPISDEDIPLSQIEAEASEPTSNLKMKSQKKPVRCVPVKKLERRRSSQCSNSEPRVVLTKLPDGQVDIKNGTVSSEFLKKCEAEQERMNAKVRNPEHSETDSDEDKPLFLLGKIIKEQQKVPSAKSSTFKQDKTDKPSASPSTKRSATEVTNPESKKNKKAVHQHTVSDSEDSDCGLVIDFDRRPSIEDRVPSFTLQRLHANEDVTETEVTNATTPRESKITSPKITPHQNNLSTSSLTVNPPTSKAGTVEPPLNTLSLPSETSKLDISSLFRDATEEAHILLELSRSGAPSLDISGAPTTSWGSAVDAPNSGLVEAAIKEQEKDESILRTLLLENGEVDLQEVTPSISLDPKPISVLQYMKNLAHQEVHDHSPLSEMDKEQLREEIQLTPDQLSVEIETNPHFIPANYECCLSNPKSTLEVIQKLRDQIRYLQRKSERKNMSVLNLKRMSKLSKYKEEILKRLMKRANMKEPSEWSQPKTQATKQFISNQPIPMATSSYAATSRLSSALLGNSLVQSKTPSATVTSSECYPGENLPTVATMVANATENYGVDLRTVTSRGPMSTTSSKTILQEVLSSKDPIYRPVAIRSPLPQLERSSDSFLLFPMSPLASRESAISPHRTSSPLLPELSRTSQLSRRLLSPPGSSSQFPPTLQPEPRQSSSFIPVAHSSFRNQKPFGAVFETEAAKTSLASSSSSGRVPSSNYAPGSTPQGSSLSSWGKTEAERSTSVKPQLINGANPSKKRTTDRRTMTSNRSVMFDPKGHHVGSSSMDSRASPMSSGLVPSHQSNSFDPRDVQLSTIGTSVDSRASPMASSRSGSSDSQVYRVSSRRYAPYDTRNYQVTSNQETSVDLRTNPMSYTSLNPGRKTNTSSSFMIVPPPTTLQSAFSESIRRSMLDGHRSQGEMSVDRQMERIRKQRNEGSVPRFVPHAGPLALTASASEFPVCAGCGMSKGCYICSLCKNTYYCSTKCQNLHWDEHSKTCSSKNNV